MRYYSPAHGDENGMTAGEKGRSLPTNSPPNDEEKRTHVVVDPSVLQRITIGYRDLALYLRLR